MKYLLIAMLCLVTIAGCKKEKEDVIPDPKPQPAQTGTPQQQFLPLLVDGDLNIYSRIFFNTRDSLAKYTFDYGDGTVETVIGSQGIHVYQQPGAYTVTVSSGDASTSKTIFISYGTERINKIDGWFVSYSKTETKAPFVITKDPQAKLQLDFDFSKESFIELISNGKYFPSSILLYYSEFKNGRLVYKSGIKENEFTLNISYKYDEDKNILKADYNFYNIRTEVDTIYDVTGMATLDLSKP